MGIRLFMAVQTPSPATMTRKQLMMTAVAPMPKGPAIVMEIQPETIVTVIIM